MTTAMNLFLRATIRENGIPFEVKLEKPNGKTVAASEEGRELEKDHSSPRYSSIKDLKAALEI